jgi:hypothetical protein
MKQLFLMSFAFLLLVTNGSFCQAADLNDHELYRIVTYTFGTKNDSQLTVTAKNSSTHFDPLMITRTKSDILASPEYRQDQFSYSTGKNFAQSFALSAYFHATPNLAFQGVIGVTKDNTDTALNSNYDSSWEANLGVIYKLFNHFSYEMHFGFMDTGDVFKNNHAYSDVESIVMISNQLTMSF